MYTIHTQSKYTHTHTHTTKTQFLDFFKVIGKCSQELILNLSKVKQFFNIYISITETILNEKNAARNES